MKENIQVITIRQVAEKANVSIGTVDRILHNRGRVSEVTREKVLNIVKELGYKPNIHASLLSARKSIKIIVIIPYFQSGEFWSLIYGGILKAHAEHSSQNLSIDTLYYNQFCEESFENACKQCMALSPNGIIMSPIHKELSSIFVEEMNKRNIPTIFLDTRLEDGCNYLAYYGIDLFDSAYLAADLMFSQKGKIHKVANINVESENGFVSEAFFKREQGFEQYIKDNNINCKIVNCTISTSDFLRNIKTLDKFFDDNPDIHHAITMTSRIHILSDWKDIRGKKDITVFGYDMTPANLKALKKGTVNILIARRIDIESYQATKALINYLVLGIKPLKKDNMFPIDILTKYNAKYYI